MRTRRIWLFQGVVAIATFLIIASFVLPLWTASITIDSMMGHEYIPNAVRIHCFGLQHNLIMLHEYIIADQTPLGHAVFAWAYLAIIVGLILYYTRIRENNGRWLLASIGIVHISYVLVAIFIVLYNRVTELGLVLQGKTLIIQPNGAITIDTALQPGYYFALAAGSMCLILAFTRNIIINKSVHGGY